MRLATVARIGLVGLIAGGLVFSLTDWIDHRLADYDKALHVGGFALLTLTALLAFPTQRRRVAVGLMALGMGVEAAQALLPGRNFGVTDMLANAVGIGAVVGVVWLVRRVRGLGERA